MLISREAPAPTLPVGHADDRPARVGYAPGPEASPAFGACIECQHLWPLAPDEDGLVATPPDCPRCTARVAREAAAALARAHASPPELAAAFDRRVAPLPGGLRRPLSQRLIRRVKLLEHRLWIRRRGFDRLRQRYECARALAVAGVVLAIEAQERGGEVTT